VLELFAALLYLKPVGEREITESKWSGLAGVRYDCAGKEVANAGVNNNVVVENVLGGCVEL
jgi:hypothetical protein